MGASAILGHVAGGFEQARQADLQRQFADEQNRRNLMSGFLQHIATNPQMLPEAQQAAAQGLLQLGQLDWKKPADIKKFFDPIFAAHAAAAQPTQTFTPPPQQGAALQQGPAANAFELQPRQLPPPPGAGTAQFTPPSTVQAGGLTYPAGGMLPTPESLQQLEAQGTGLKAGAALGSQIKAREQALGPYLQQLPPIAAAGIAAGIPGMGSLMVRPLGTGGGLAGELRAQGFPVPDNIPDNQYVQAKQTMSGPIFTPSVPPSGQYQLTPQGPITKQEALDQQAQRQFGLFQKENRIRFGQQWALADKQLGNALTKMDYGAAQKIINASQVKLQDGIDRMTQMDQNLPDALNGDQQAQVALLTAHIGMTGGAIPGARVGRFQMEEAMKSAPWMQQKIAQWFHQDPQTGDYEFDGFKGGVNLTPQQMHQMVNLGHERVAVMEDRVGRQQELYQDSTKAKPTRAMTEKPTGKKQLAAPPSGGGGTTRIRASDGSLHDIPSANLDKARKIDPGLQVVQ